MRMNEIYVYVCIYVCVYVYERGRKGNRNCHSYFHVMKCDEEKILKINVR